MTANEPLIELLTAAGRFVRLAGGLTTSDQPHAVVRALAILEENGELRITEFARLDRSSQPAATTLIGRLADKGFVERRKDPSDSRAVVVAITELGRTQLDEARGAAGRALAPYVGDVDEREIAAALASLTRLNEALGRNKQ
ncbi:MarR family winged helix-turn-helix transcriptional regulator [Smaragdicoccus niigatensis]|uniref:MarR family winged helix-turn-helix transcriptional regulator n=1 Tax=Smaragdicoccus niigatensis TaxID=359359 RepID=UPI00035CBA01|nr:MarR family transcriptional regulator [Smaragdicoccus niigatensis]